MPDHPAPHPAPGPGPSDRSQDTGELTARALEGTRALIQLLGGDPGIPRLRGLPERHVQAMLALVPGAAPGASLPHGHTVPQTIAEILTAPQDPPGRPHRAVALPGFGHVTTCATHFTAICDTHLTPFTGILHLAHDPGPDGPPVTAHRLDWLAAVLARGLTSPDAITVRAVHALRKHLAGSGSAAHIRPTGPCPLPHRTPPPPPELTGTLAGGPLMQAFLAWSTGR